MGSKKSAKGSVDCVGFPIIRALQKRGKVTLVGFGISNVAKRAARRAENPRMGEEIKIKSKNIPKVALGKA